MACPAFAARARPMSSEPRLSEAGRLLSWIVASLALFDGLIHVAVVRHHLDYSVVAAGFIVIGSAQVLFGVLMVARPSAPARTVGLLLHLAIVSTWLLSRTVGLALVPGAEDPAPVGVADITATVLSVAVIASLVAMTRLEQRTQLVAVPARVSKSIAGAVAIVALAVTVPAASAGHDHTDHDRPSAEASGTEGSRSPTATIHDSRPHVHE